jgi:hypothetical protein
MFQYAILADVELKVEVGVYGQFGTEVETGMENFWGRRLAAFTSTLVPAVNNSTTKVEYPKKLEPGYYSAGAPNEGIQKPGKPGFSFAATAKSPHSLQQELLLCCYLPLIPEYLDIVESRGLEAVVRLFGFHRSFPSKWWTKQSDTVLGLAQKYKIQATGVFGESAPIFGGDDVGGACQF